MTKFKVEDKVVRLAGGCTKWFIGRLGHKAYYIVTGVSEHGYWIQVDGVAYGTAMYPWRSENFELYQEPEADELPPVPDREVYLNFKRDRGNDQRLVLDKDNGEGEGLMYIGVIPRTGSTRAQMEIGINIDPDSALQLAHDLRRMAMEIKRKGKAQ